MSVNRANGGADAYRDQLPVEARSLAKYQFNDEENESAAVLQAISYDGSRNTQGLVRLHYRVSAEMASLLRTTFATSRPVLAPLPPVLGQHPAGAASLPSTPPEIMSMILGHLDIKSTLALRRTDRRTKSLVEGTAEYRTCVNFAMDTMLGMIKTHVAQYHTLSDLVRALRTRDCRQCGAFAGLVFLPTLDRICFKCADYPTGAVFPVVRMPPALRRSSIKKKTGVPVVLTLPDQQHSNRRLCLAAPHPSLSRRPRASHYRFRRMACAPLPYFNPKADGAALPTNGVLCAGCKMLAARSMVGPENFQSIITRRLLNDLAGRLYTDGDFLAHFSWCREAQGLWLEEKHRAEEGKKVLAANAAWMR